MNIRTQISLTVIIFVVCICVMGVQPAAAHTSEIKFMNDDCTWKTNDYEVNTKSYDYFNILAQLYVDGEWRSLREIIFVITSPENKLVYDNKSYTSPFGDRGACVGVGRDYFKDWALGEYTIIAVYGGNEGEGWPPALATRTLHVHQ